MMVALVVAYASRAAELTMADVSLMTTLAAHVA